MAFPKRRILTERETPDHTLPVRIRTDAGAVVDAECAVYLPRGFRERPLLELTTPGEILNLAVFEFAVEGKAQDVWGEASLRSERTQYRQMHYGGPHSPGRIIADPVDLLIANAYLPEPGAGEFEVQYVLSPSVILRPIHIRSSSYTGEVHIQYGRRIEIVSKNGRQVTFTLRFPTGHDEQPEFAQPTLVAECKCASISEAQELFSWIDALLVLVSFVERRRCSSFGWSASNGRSEAQYFRAGMWFDDERDDRDPIIEPLQFAEFVAASSVAFESDEVGAILRQVMNCLVSAQTLPIEPSYLLIFSALEAAVTSYARSTGQDKVVAERKFKVVRKNLSDCLSGKNLSSEASDRMRAKIEELNRRSLADIFATFVQAKGVLHDDLWPLRSDGSGASLASIRNQLAHGAPISPEQYGAMNIALIHLRWLVERIVLASLGWPCDKSSVSPARLRQMIPYNDWKKHRAALTRQRS